MKEKRGILGGEKNNMVKSQPKKGYNNCVFNRYNLKSSYLNIHDIKKLQIIGYCLRDYAYDLNSKYDCNEYLIYLIHELIKIQEKLEK